MKRPFQSVCLLAVALLAAISVYGQIDDGTYYAFRPVKPTAQPDVISVEAITLPNGIMRFTDDQTQKALDGKYHLALNHSRYVIAEFKNGILDGSWNQYFNNRLKQRGTLVAGVYDGPFWEQTASGHDDYLFQKGMLVQQESWFDNGQLEQRKQYDEQGKLDGEIILYDQQGTVTERRNYVHGKQEGPQMQQGFGIQTFTLKDGIMVGPYEEVTENGGLLRRGTYDEKGEKIGTWYYGSGGDVSREESYVDGKLDGAKKDYYSKGLLWHYDEYVKGKRNGKSIEYSHSSGKPFVEYIYRDDVRHGEYKIWQAGELSESGLYRDGVQVMKKSYRDGKLRDIYLLDERGNLARVEGYNEVGKRIYKNTTFKKHPTIALVETPEGVVDVVRE